MSAIQYVASKTYEKIILRVSKTSLVQYPALELVHIDDVLLASPIYRIYAPTQMRRFLPFCLIVNGTLGPKIFQPNNLLQVRHM